MELLESDDMKSQLLRKAAKHREELDGDVKFISDRTKQIATTALVVGGSLALAYLLVRQLSGGSKKKTVKVRPRKIKLVRQDDNDGEVQTVEASSPGIITQMGTAIASQATVMLLNLAKEKLMEYLQAQAEKKENNDRS